ncbi:phage tail protein [Cytobacillus sp. IB215665]|uniref:phage tail protein n=1 Tax=Cytobacillus sp. IB215665 TaxID=3097357 RepID=UPI002A0EB6CC|nr:phage tail protein [Cytobacillus sp. IB215665]MDX8367779.1 phage tail protein [Cytobacillus sp. IB215665]
MIKINAEQLEKLEGIFANTPGQIPIVTARAINRAAEAAKTQASRSARDIYIIKHKGITDTIKIKKANSSNLNASVRSRGSKIDLIKFKVNPKKPQPKRKTPIVVTVKKGSKKPFKDGFVAETSNGHINVFTRVSNKRLPIKGHYGPSVPQMLGNESVVKHVEDRAYEVLDTRLEHEINRLLGGRS